MTDLLHFVSFRFVSFLPFCFAYVSCCVVVKDGADAVDNETMAQRNDEGVKRTRRVGKTTARCVCVCECIVVVFAVYPTVLWRLFMDSWPPRFMDLTSQALT